MTGDRGEGQVCTDRRTVLQAENVRFVRERRALLDDVSLTVREGEHWALLGANGAGKSTLLSLLGAYRHPTSGQVHILGHRLGRVDVRELRAWIGHVDPHHPLRSARTVHEIVLTGVTGSIEIVPHWKPEPDDLDRAEELIELLGLRDHHDARWPTLSHGERGRTLIARALMPGCSCSTSPPRASTSRPASGCWPRSTPCAPRIRR